MEAYNTVKNPNAERHFDDLHVHNDGTLKEPLNGEQTNSVVVIEDRAKKHLIYGLTDTPPLHITIVSGLQVSFSCCFVMSI